MLPHVPKVVLTGGPCAGKSTALAHLGRALRAAGVRVAFSREVATDLIQAGGTPWKGVRERYEFQRAVVRISLAQECALAEYVRATSDGAPAVLICDRGIADCRAYVGEEEYRRVLAEMGETPGSIFSRYDLVVHMVTAAMGAEAYYQNENNAARYESAEEARRADANLRKAWCAHPHVLMVDNRAGGFPEKLRRTTAAVMRRIGMGKEGREGFECERKWLVSKLPGGVLESAPWCDIVQYYLPPRGGTEVRVRRMRYADGTVAYYLTEKRDTADPASRLEREVVISEKEFRRHVDAAGGMRRLPAVRKRRYYVDTGSYRIEVDQYFDVHGALWGIIAEIEYPYGDLPPELPAGWEAREVTGDARYRNATLAREGFPPAR